MSPSIIVGVIAWIQVLAELYKKGSAAVDDVKAVIRQHGIEVDDATLDAISSDADVRKAREDALIDGDSK